MGNGDLHARLIKNDILKAGVERMDEIRARIATISDPRYASYIKHQLSDILLIIMCGVLSGLDTLICSLYSEQ